MLALPGRLFLRPTTLRKVFDKTLAARRLPARCMSTKENSPYEANKKPKTDMADLLRVKKISEHATLPVRGSDGAAGYDLASAYECGTSRTRAFFPAGETRARRASTARVLFLDDARSLEATARTFSNAKENHEKKRPFHKNASRAKRFLSRRRRFRGPSRRTC